MWESLKEKNKFIDMPMRESQAKEVTKSEEYQHQLRSITAK